MSLFALPLSPEAAATIAANEAASQAAEAAAAYFAAYVEDMTALAFAKDLAGELDVPVDRVWHELLNIPAHMMSALESPRGWGALAAVVACNLGLLAPDYRPQVH